MVKIRVSANTNDLNFKERVMLGKEFIEFTKNYIRNNPNSNYKVSDIKTIGDAGSVFKYSKIWARPEFEKRKEYGFTVEKKSYSKMYGSMTYIVKVFYKYKLIGESTFSSGGTRGAESEAYQILVEKGLADKEISKWNSGHYRYENSDVKLIKIQ